MNANVNEITINGQVYVPKGTAGSNPAASTDGLAYCIVRTFSAGVFAGYLKCIEGKIGIVLEARRLWYWAGAASLSQLAVDGTSKPKDCKFPVAVPEVTLTEIIEVIPCTEKAKESITSVKVWGE